jgi:hypothetical protein
MSGVQLLDGEASRADLEDPAHALARHLRQSHDIAMEPRQATKVVNVSGNTEMLVWVVDGLPLPARLLQRRNGKDEIDLRIISVR